MSSCGELEMSTRQTAPFVRDGLNSVQWASRQWKHTPKVGSTQREPVTERWGEKNKRGAIGLERMDTKKAVVF